MKFRIKEPYFTWSLGGVKRKYLVGNLDFALARTIFRPEHFSVSTGHGEQRGAIEAEVRRLRKEIEGGYYTPTTFKVSTKECHRKFLQLTDEDYFDQNNQPYTQSVAKIDVDVDNTPPFPLIDGEQRMAALERIWRESDGELRKTIESTPITFLMYLDGDTKLDFIRVNLGKPVDRSHKLTLQVLRGALPEKDLPNFQLALDVAKKLNDNKDSPFYKCIKFDAKSKASLPINSLCSKGGTEGGCSLVGLAKVGRHFDLGEDELVGAVMGVWETAQKHAKETTERYGLLCPPPDGTKGGAGLLIGLGLLVVYHSGGLEGDALGENFERAIKRFDGKVQGSFTSKQKRQWIGIFAHEYFAGQQDLHDGVPVELLRIIPPGAFMLSPLPKDKKRKK